jgi:hypothetical protein
MLGEAVVELVCRHAYITSSGSGVNRDLRGATSSIS